MSLCQCVCFISRVGSRSGLTRESETRHYSQAGGALLPYSWNQWYEQENWVMRMQHVSTQGAHQLLTMVTWNSALSVSKWTGNAAVHRTAYSTGNTYFSPSQGCILPVLPLQSSLPWSKPTVLINTVSKQHPITSLCYLYKHLQVSLSKQSLGQNLFLPVPNFRCRCHQQNSYTPKVNFASDSTTTTVKMPL